MLWLVSFSQDDDRELSAPAIKKALDEGTITQDTIVWRDGMPEWLPIKATKELAEALLALGAEPERRKAEPASSEATTATPPADRLSDRPTLEGTPKDVITQTTSEIVPRDAAASDEHQAESKATEPGSEEAEPKEAEPKGKAEPDTKEAQPASEKEEAVPESLDPDDVLPDSAEAYAAVGRKLATPPPPPFRSGDPLSVNPSAVPLSITSGGDTDPPAASVSKKGVFAVDSAPPSADGARPMATGLRKPPQRKSAPPPSHAEDSVLIASKPPPVVLPKSSIDLAALQASAEAPPSEPRPGAQSQAEATQAAPAPPPAAAPPPNITVLVLGSVSILAVAGVLAALIIANTGQNAQLDTIVAQPLATAGSEERDDTTAQEPEVAEPEVPAASASAGAAENASEAIATIASGGAATTAEPQRRTTASGQSSASESGSTSPEHAASMSTPTSGQASGSSASTQATPSESAETATQAEEPAAAEVTDKPQLPPFDARAAAAALSAAGAQASACRQEGDPSGTARVMVTFSPSGRATRALILGPPFASTKTGGCIAAKLRSATVPAFSGDLVTVQKSIVIK